MSDTPNEKPATLRPIMFVGTGSDVGKSVVATAFCRIFRQDGYHPAPFKAQNMALNSFATPEGLEIGRAQAEQAEAAGIECHTDMNPLLLKPSSDHTSQVILNGKPIGNYRAYDYFRKEGRETLRQAVHCAFDRLAARFHPIVMEGAGSISEINLRETDLVNMPMAMHAEAAVFLVADIDRGGVFASVYGSIMLLREEERPYVKGILINKFRGDLRLFEEGVKMIEQLCGIPVVGVIPYFTNIHIEAEDSVSLETKGSQASEEKVNIAVIRLAHLSNFTDFAALEHDERVQLYYTTDPEEIRKAEIILLPGSKSTLSDLHALRQQGLDESIVAAHHRGATVMGICGGYQMMGKRVCDPHHIEGDIEELPGLGLLPLITTIGEEKVTRQVSFHFLDHTEPCQGYEIHMGETRPTTETTDTPLNRLADGTQDGYFASPTCFGTYLHGILDNAVIIDYLLAPHTTRQKSSSLSYAEFKQQQYDLLATHVRQHVNIPLIYQILAQHD